MEVMLNHCASLYLWLEMLIIFPICLSSPFFLFSWQNSEAMISIDMPAGPSEVLVIADRHASPVHIAADLLSQVLNFLFSLCYSSVKHAFVRNQSNNYIFMFMLFRSHI